MLGHPRFCPIYIFQLWVTLFCPLQNKRSCWLTLGSLFPAPAFGESGNGRVALVRNFSKLKRLFFQSKKAVWSLFANLCGQRDACPVVTAASPLGSCLPLHWPVLLPAGMDPAHPPAWLSPFEPSLLISFVRMWYLGPE